MGKKRRMRAAIGVLAIVILLIGMIPGMAAASTTDGGSTWLAWLSFATSADSTLIAGETGNINVQLWDNYSNPYTGSVASASITDSDGVSKIYQVSGNSGDYTISNVTLEPPGIIS